MSAFEFCEDKTQEGMIEYVVQELQGTCTGSIGEYEDEYLSMGYSHDALLEGIDNHIFNCEGCGWWCEVGDGNGEVCSDCEDDYDS